jgi:hypothetical protein
MRGALVDALCAAAEYRTDDGWRRQQEMTGQRCGYELWIDE